MVDDQELVWMPAWKLRDLIGRKEVSPVEITRLALERIENLEPKIHAFITICNEQAMDAARNAEKCVMRGETLGLLHGVPISLKDEAWVKGVRATAGSLLFKDFVPAEDSTCAGRLRASGAIIVGMTNVPEFYIWSRVVNKLHPETLNPWDLRRSSGASSGGTAASIAAGITPLGIGSDGGGSIRIPSALCGVIGLFPTIGRIPNTGSFSYARIGSLGPIARDVRDIAITMQVLSGPDGKDNRPYPPACDFLSSLNQGVEGMRIAWTHDFGHIFIQNGLEAVVRNAVTQLESCGVIVEEPELHFDNTWEWLGKAIRGEIAWGNLPPPYTGTKSFYAMCMQKGNFERLTEYAQMAMSAPPVNREDYEDTKRWIAALKQKFQSLFKSYDAILSPTMPVVAPLLPPGIADPYPEFCCGTFFTAIANLAELPAASYPCGLLDGLPVGLQIIGKPGREDIVLQLCHALEKVIPFNHRPSLAT